MRSLMQCNNVDEVANVERDHFDEDDYTILCDGSTVWLSEQAVGGSTKQEIQIPKKIFDKLVQSYIKPQKEHSPDESDKR